jgi:hypothetical protein
MWAGFAVFWESGVIRSGAPLFVRLWGLPFLAIGAYLVVGRFLADALARRNTAYGVTNHRVIVISGVLSRTTTTYPLRTLPAFTLSERRNGEGDIVLASSDMNHVAVGGVVGRGQSVPPALEFLADVRRIYEILRDAHRRAT